METLKSIDVKVFATQGDDIEAHEFIAVLQRWIREHSVPGVLIDVADYSHIVNGPGVILVGHQGNTSVDYAEGKMGLQYRYKHPAEDTVAARIQTAVKAALDAAALLENEPEFKGRLAFDKNSVHVVSNDRLEGPNADDAAEAFLANVTEAVSGIVEGTATRVENDPRKRLTVAVG